MSKLKEYYLELKRRVGLEFKTFNGNEIWDDNFGYNFNKIIQLIVEETGDEDYNRFMLHIRDEGEGYIRVKEPEYISNLMGVIGKLEGKHPEWIEETLIQTPSTTVNVSQKVEIEMLLKFTISFQSIIDEKLSEKDNKLSKNERTFLQEIKSGLAKVNSYSSLISLVLTTAQTVGLTIEQIMPLLIKP